MSCIMFFIYMLVAYFLFVGFLKLLDWAKEKHERKGL